MDKTIIVDDFMSGILSRVLSDEVREQEKWRAQEMAAGYDVKNRDNIIKGIKLFMLDNEIPWYEHYV